MDDDVQDIEVIDPLGGSDGTDDPVGRSPLARARRRQQVLGALLLVAVVAGPLVGAAVERRAADDGVAVGADTADPDGDRAAAEPADGALTPRTTIAPFESLGEDLASDDVAASSGFGYGGPGAYGPTMTWLGSGAVGDAEVRLLVNDYGVMEDGNPFWDAPAGCNPTGWYSIEVSSPRFALQVGTDRFEAPGRPDGTVQLVGVAEGDPRWVVVAAVDPAGAVVTFPDGQVAPAVDVAGFAVGVALAPGWADVPEQEMGHRATVASGGTTHEVASWWYPSEQFQRDACQPPPPALPEPGEQPADVAAATEAVRTALTTVFGPSDADQKAQALEHPDVVLPAMEQLKADWPDVQATAELRDLVFTAPDRAAVRFDLDATIASFTDVLGEARLLEDGRWVITTETACAQLGRGGVTCEPPG